MGRVSQLSIKYGGSCLFIFSHFFQVLFSIMSGKTSSGGGTLASSPANHKTWTGSVAGGDVRRFRFVPAPVSSPDSGSLLVPGDQSVLQLYRGTPAGHRHKEAQDTPSASHVPFL